MKNKSPLRYPGGKTRACKILDEVICENYSMKNYDTIASPFFGGGSFEFFLQNKYDKKLIVNDKFELLYNFWKIAQNDSEKLCSELDKNINVTKEIFYEHKKNIAIVDELKSAISYFIINRCSFSGSTYSGGFSQESSKKRFTKSSIERIRNLDLTNTEFHNLDFKPFLEEKINEKTFIFLDPPYYLGKKSRLYGTNGDLHDNFNHEELLDCIKEINNDWIMTYNNCEYIKSLYEKYTIIETNWTYGMNKDKKSSEIIIMSKLKS